MCDRGCRIDDGDNQSQTGENNMRRKLISMLAGAVVLVAPLTTMAALAQSNAPNQLFPALSGIQLTQEQKTQLT
jgi:hypothetical protein